MVKSLNLSRDDRIILGHVAFGRDEEESSALVGQTAEFVVARRKEIMAQLGDLGLMANENMLGISLFMTMTQGLNANRYDKAGNEIPNRPDMPTRINTAKMFNLITGGMLGEALINTMRKMFDRQVVQDVANPPVWIDKISSQTEPQLTDMDKEQGDPHGT